VGRVSSIRLDQVNLVVRDVVASRAFYAGLGLEFTEEPDPVWAPHHATAPQGAVAPIDVELDSTVFTRRWNTGWPGGTGVVLGFKVGTRQEVDDLVAAVRAKGVPVQQDPYDAFWGARYAIVSDPDGNGVGIMSPVDPAMRTPPPPPS
jgi:predicted lactoylglutathione lyase